MLKIEKEILKYRHEEGKTREGMDVLLQKARASNKPWLMVKTWQGKEVDFELQDEWLISLNKYADKIGIRVCTVCAGHPNGVSGLGMGSTTFPNFGFHCPHYDLACDLGSIFIQPRTEVRVHAQCDDKYASFQVLVGATFINASRNRAKVQKWWGLKIKTFEDFVKNKNEN